MDAEEWIKETTKLLGCMPIAVQKKFALHWSKTIMENNENLNEVIEEMVKNTDRYVKLKRWMDKRFSKNSIRRPVSSPELNRTFYQPPPGLGSAAFGDAGEMRPI